MKELNRTDRLTIATILVAAILVIGLVTLKKPEVSYTRSADETLGVIISSEDVISPEEMIQIMQQTDSRYFLVDVRNPVEFHKSHIGQAVNIPVQDILNRQNLKTFTKLSKDGVTIVLVGKDQLEANGAWLILKQTGYDNVRVMPGGYDYYADKGISNNSFTEIPANVAEKARCDFKAVLSSFGSVNSSVVTKTPEPVNIIKKEKKSATEGGC
jgi:rhodanese-related sulfurtransferase